MFKYFFQKIYPFEPKALVFNYHRIAKLTTDPWQMAVSSENFEQQLLIFKKKYTIIPLKTLVVQVVQKKLSPNTMCITFDNGYGDNYLHAKPILEKHRIPATFFIPCELVGQKKRFWWDDLENIFLYTITLPRFLKLSFNDQEFEFDLKRTFLSPDEFLKHTIWKWPARPPTQRCLIYMEIWQLLKKLTKPKIDLLLTEIKKWADLEVPQKPAFHPINKSQLRILANHPLIDLGINTCTHPSLSYHSRKIQMMEIGDCKKHLDTLSAKIIDVVAYPYGDYNDVTLDVMKALKITAGFTTNQQAITNNSDILKLGRIQVKNEPGIAFAKSLKKLK